MLSPRYPAASSFRDGPSQVGGRHAVLRADERVCHGGTHSVRGDSHALKQLMRATLDQDPVFEGPRLHFVGVADEEHRARPVGLCGDEAPLAAGRKARTATSRQGRVKQYLDDLSRGHVGQHPAEGRVTSPRCVLLEGERPSVGTEMPGEWSLRSVNHGLNR